MFCKIYSNPDDILLFYLDHTHTHTHTHTQREINALIHTQTERLTGGGSLRLAKHSILFEKTGSNLLQISKGILADNGSSL